MLMECVINSKKIETNVLLRNLLYLEDLIKEHFLIGRLNKGVGIKDKFLIQKWGINNKTISYYLETTGVIKQSKNDYPSFKSYRVDKSLLLIYIFACIGISAFDRHDISKAKREGFNLNSLIEGIDSQLKNDKKERNTRYTSNKKYEQRVINYIYDSLSLLVNAKEPFFTNHFNKQKTSVLLFFENSSSNTLIPTTNSDLSNQLINVLVVNIKNKKGKQIDSVTLRVKNLFQSNFNSIISLSSSSSSLSYLYNSVHYIDLFVEKYSDTLLSHKGKAMRKNSDSNYTIEEYLNKIKGFGYYKFSIEKNDIMNIKDSWIDDETFEKECVQTIINFLNTESPLFKKINTLIDEVNKLNPIYKFVFNPKVEIKEDKKLQTTLLKASGRQYNKLCDVKAHTKIGEIGEAKRNTLLKKFCYDTEGFDISSTIWTITKALMTKKADINFDLKQELVNEKYFDKNGVLISDRKSFKPLNQITYFCRDKVHAWITYNTQSVRKEFEKKFGVGDHWLELDEDVFTKIYYKENKLTKNDKSLIDSIFFYESILELSVIRDCLKEGIDVLNVYDCFFLKNRNHYPRLKEIIETELACLIDFYYAVRWSYPVNE